MPTTPSPERFKKVQWGNDGGKYTFSCGYCMTHFLGFSARDDALNFGEKHQEKCKTDWLLKLKTK